MTKLEYGKCEKLMEEAITNAKDAQMGYKKYNDYLADEERGFAELEQRKADQNYGYAEGIYNVLDALDFKHDRIKELLKLL